MSYFLWPRTNPPCWRPRFDVNLWSVIKKKAALCMHWLKQHNWAMLWAARWVSGTRGTDKVSQCAGSQDHPGRRHAGSLPSGSAPGGRSLRCPAKLMKLHVWEKRTSCCFLCSGRGSLEHHLRSCLPLGSGRWPLSLATQPGAQGSR